jgi:hypothetical protein
VLASCTEALQVQASEAECIFVLKRCFTLKLSATVYEGAHGSVVVKALCYKPEGRGFDSR